MIFDKPNQVNSDTLVSFDPNQRKITKIPLLGGTPIEINLSFDFDRYPNTFYYINSDSIVFSTGDVLFLTDQSGTEFHSVSLFKNLDAIKDEVYTEYPFDGFSDHLFYDESSQSVLYYFAKRSQVEKRKVFGRIDLRSGDWESLPIYHPKEYTGVPLNYTTFPSVTWTSNGLGYIYSISPTVVTYDTISKSQKELIIKSFEGKQHAEPQTNRDTWSTSYFEDWVLSSPNYLKLMYDPHRKVYYRFSQSELNRSSDEEDYYTFLVKNREVYLSILDQEFNLVYNQMLPKGKYDPTKSFVFSKGLWVPHDISIVNDEQLLYGDLFQVVQ
ncbi:MAG: DUF4221 family protein [Mongoliitalea sp.]